MGKLGRRQRGWNVARIAAAVTATGTLLAASVAPTAASAPARSLKASAGGNAVPLSFTIQGGWGTSWSFNPFNPSFFGNIYAYAFLPLAFAQPPKYAGGYTPQLATSWSVSPSAVTVHLRPSARWQDGKPLTSADVVTTLLLQGTNGNSIWEDITGARAAGPHTVVVTLRHGASARAVLDTLLGVYPVPASEYGQFVTPGLQKDLVSYWANYSKSGTSAATTPAGKAVTAAFTKLSKYAPKRFIGDGPFRLTNISTSAAILKRWSGFWDAKKIHVPTFEVIATGSGAITYGDLISHRVNLSQSGETWLLLKKWRAGQGNGWAVMPNYAAFALYFNSRHYPLNMVGVRRAIAYVINRPKVESLAGYAHIYLPDRIPDGLTNSTTDAYFSAKQRQQLNSYPTDPAKAAKTLTALGFHKRGGEWYTPKGQQFTLTLDGPAGWQDSVSQCLVMGRMLTAFGIKTTVTAVEQPAYWSYQTEGRYDLDWGWAQQGLNPLAGYSNALVNQNFVSKSEPGMGFGPVAKVPGLGTVNIVSTLKTQSTNVGPGTTLNRLAWDWARFVNSQLPYIAFGDRLQQVDYVTSQYKDWPPRSSPQWQVLGINMSGGIVMMMEKGEIRPVG